MFDSITVSAPGGDIRIRCERPSDDATYIESISVGGKPCGYRIEHKRLTGGEEIVFKLKKERKP